MASLRKDYRYALRTLARTPGYTIVAWATLALGIGANTAIFSVINQALLHPAGVEHPEQVVSLRVHYDKLALYNIGVSAPDFTDVRDSTRLFDSAALIQTADFNYTGLTLPQRLLGGLVSWRWFDVFEAQPQIGRVFRPEEDRPNANREVVLSYEAWNRVFGGDPGVVGRSMELNELPYRIVGVMRRDFRWPLNVDLWTPLGLADADYQPENRFNESYGAMARLRPGVTFKTANAFVNLLGRRVANSDTRAGAYARDSLWGMFLLPFTDFIAGDTKRPMLVLMGAVAFVLLIACSNVAGLMLARGSGRGREIAIRAALGAGRWDLIRQSLAETLLLSLAGALAGLAIAFAGLKGLLALAPEGLPVAVSPRIDGSVLLFTAVAGIAAAILFGVGPAWQISRVNRYELLKEGGRANTAGISRRHLRSALVVGEAALALVLLAGAGLFLRSLVALENVNPGFQSAGLITGSVSLPRARYDNPARRVAFYRAVVSHLAHIPGAASAAAGFPIPFSGNGGSASFAIEGRPTPPGDPGPHGDIGYVSPGFFATLKIPIWRGRVFTELDRAETEPVVLIDDVLARQYWPDQDPIGKHMRRGNSSPWATIVGVVGHIKNADLAGEDVKGKYYYPIYQSPPPTMSFAVRASSHPSQLAPAVREAVRSVDRSQPVASVRPLMDMVESSLAPRRFVVDVLGIFAAISLLLAVIGLYGVIAYAVTERTQELGVRMALGARQSEILTLVLRQGVRLAGAGTAIGQLVALILSRLLRHELFHISAFDPLTFLLTATALMAAALLASYIPARRATRVDPMVALRYE